MTIRNKAGYEDRARRLGSDLEPLTLGEKLAVLGITLTVAIITVEVVIRVGSMF